MKIRQYTYLITLFTLSFVALTGQTIEQKKLAVSQFSGDLDWEAQGLLHSVNSEMSALKSELREIQNEVNLRYREMSSEDLEQTLGKIRALKMHMKQLEQKWGEEARTQSGEDPYALWNQSETTLGQLIADYGSQDFIYVYAPAIGALPVSVSSALAIPRESWNQVLEMILSSHGVGIEQVNSAVKRLYLLNEEQGDRIALITDSIAELDLLDDHEKAILVLKTPALQARSVASLLQKFANYAQIHVVGSDIYLVASSIRLKELIKVYEFTFSKESRREYRIFPLGRVDPDEMQKIIEGIFSADKSLASMVRRRGTQPSSLREHSELASLEVSVLKSLGNALFVIGSPEQLALVERLIREVEEDLQGTVGKTTFWYTAKHTEAAELAETLESIYELLVENSGDLSADQIGEKLKDTRTQPSKEKRKKSDSSNQDSGISIVVNPDVVDPTKKKQAVDKKTFKHFVVDEKTGSIIMVVESDLLPRLLDLAKRLDVPKKMVQVDILLFEQRVKDKNQFGMNLLKMGSEAQNSQSSGLSWNASSGSSIGMGKFFLSRTESNLLPAFDVAYNFLISQEDIRINANPSVVTVNQTPAYINIVDEISVSTGIQEVDTGTRTSLKDTFTRAQYGTNIEITPTIHFNDNEEEGVSITLETNIEFDSIKENRDSRPDVTRRQVMNRVRVADGETIILGGLRQKQSQDNVEKLPFLGEIPGLGKLFSTSSLVDETVEMFIFLTPRVIKDDSEDFQKSQIEQLKKRPGDIPELLRRFEEARKWSKKQAFESSVKMLFGRGAVEGKEEKEYDGS